MTERKSIKEIADMIYGSGVVVGDDYIHNKTGDRYIAITVSVMEADLSLVVVYAPTDHNLGYSVTFVRPVAEFLEKFTNA